MHLPRRRFLILAGSASAMAPASSRATPSEVAALIRAMTGGPAPRPGRIKLDLPAIVENGNAVALTVGLTEAMSQAVRLTDIHILAEGNPNPSVAHFRFGPRSGAPRVATRIRLATSQTVHAIGVLADGSCWSDSVELLVTLSACLDN